MAKTLSDSAQERILPPILEQERPAEGASGKTGKDAIGEKQAAEAIESYLDQIGADPKSLFEGKDVYQKGPDHGFVAKDPQTGDTIVLTSDAKDYNKISASDVRDYQNTDKADNFIADSLTGIPSIGETHGSDVAEPLVWGTSRHPGTGYEYSYEMSDPSYYDSSPEEIIDDEQFEASDSWGTWETQANELVAEQKAQRDEGKLQFYVITTGAKMSPASTDKLESSDIFVTHINTPTGQSTEKSPAVSPPELTRGPLGTDPKENRLERDSDILEEKESSKESTEKEAADLEQTVEGEAAAQEEEIQVEVEGNLSEEEMKAIFNDPMIAEAAADLKPGEAMQIEIEEQVEVQSQGEAQEQQQQQQQSQQQNQSRSQ
jgi:hypothetical protein